MKELKGSQTEKNIRAAFEGESQARNRYTFFEEQARGEGHDHIAELYQRMARNETMHAKLWFQLLQSKDANTVANVLQSSQGETMEAQQMYPDFAKIAREEGYTEIADLFDHVAAIERDHANTFLRALSTLTQKQGEAVLEPMQPRQRCVFCGAVFEDRPDVCPVCGAIGSFEQTMD